MTTYDYRIHGPKGMGEDLALNELLDGYGLLAADGLRAEPIPMDALAAFICGAMAECLILRDVCQFESGLWRYWQGKHHAYEDVLKHFCQPLSTNEEPF